MKVRIATLALTTALSTAIIASAASAQGIALKPYAKAVLPANVTPIHYDVAVTPDAAKLGFTGQVTIAIDVKSPTRKITLNAADLTFSRVALDNGKASPIVSFDPEQQTATFTFARPVTAGRHHLSIDYAGKIYEQASGLFALDYPAAGGKARALFTQFENSDERRFVPSWDEPGRKATYTLTATVPADLMALSNMPIASSEALPGGLKRVHFAQTPKMSSYLLFFGLGDFERVHQMVDGVDVGVVVRRGQTDKAAYALQAESQILPYYNQYFGTKFPLPKLDMIAGPGSSQFFGAMENWGAIFYFESDLLVDPKTATPAEQQGIFSVVAHETAHQWFGDLVTMAWWDDLWLNEGFASWMQEKAADHVHPEWNPWLRTLGAKQQAMTVDSRAGSHPIITPIRDVLQAAGAFDTITYSKGQAVIRMIESFTGDDAFRDGVRAYIAHHAYGNTVTDDLWRELDKTSRSPVSPIAHDFTLQSGVPLITAQSVEGGLTLSQSRFGVDAESKAPLLWRVPVRVSNGQTEQVVEVSGPAPERIALATGNAPVVVNADQTAYFRTRYDDTLFTGIMAGYPGLKPADQLGLLNDTYSLSAAGYAPMGQLMALMQRVPIDADPIVLTSLVQRLAGLDAMFDGLPGQAAFRAYSRRILSPIGQKLGWSAQPGESANVSTLRESVLFALGRAGDPQVLAEAHRRYAAFLVDPASLDPISRQVALGLVAYNADQATWDQLHGMALKSQSIPEKMEFYGLLGAAHDPTLARQTLELSLSGEMPPTLSLAVLRGPVFSHPEMGYDFVTAHWDRFAPGLEPTSRAGFVPRIASASSDPATIGKLTAWADKNIPASAHREVTAAIATITYQAQLKSERLPEIDRWLAAHPS